MATDQKSTAAEETPMTLLKQEVGHYLKASVKHMAQKAGTRLADAADHLTGDGQGPLAQAGSRVLHGDESVSDAVKDTVKDSVKGTVTDKAKDVTDKAKEALGGGGSSGGEQSGDIKATNIVEMIDVGVPLRTAYDHWTEYERFSGFTKGVQSAERGEEATSEWTVKVGPSTRTWKATVQEQIPDDRIVWTSEGGQGTTQGAVSFHEITPTLTRMILIMVYYPTGIVEKTGNIWRAQGRRVRLDFKHFQRYVTFADEEAEGWRGEIRDGEVVRTHEEAMEEEADGEEDEEEVEEEDEEAEEDTDEDAEDAEDAEDEEGAEED